MSAKFVLVFCVQALLIQLAFSQCTSRAAVDASGYPSPYSMAGAGLPYNGLGAPGMAYDGLGWASRGANCNGMYSGIAQAMEFTPTSGGGLAVTSGSAVAPTGISVVSENVYEGGLSVAGELPFVGTTGVEGVVPSAGAGAINHDCGNGVTAMASDSVAFVPAATIPPIAAAFPAASPLASAATLSPAGAISPAGLSSAAAMSRASPFASAGFGRFGPARCAGRGVLY